MQGGVSVFLGFCEPEIHTPVQAIIPAVETLLDDCIAEDPKKARLADNCFITVKCCSWFADVLNIIECID